ncbi:MAG: 50S ribosomal protein L10 [Candidatus Ratteibacteria bacterium]|nr:50S ribosomal protein L10 [Candidatus Ratteibacteria bacterium]
MDKKAKQESLDFLVDRLSNLKSMVFTNFKGLSAQEMSSIKRLAKEGNGEYKVVKNTIALKAMAKSGREEANQFISGSCAIAFLPEDPISLLKVLVNFSKEHKALILKGGVIEGESVSDEGLKKIAILPSRPELLTKVVCDLNAPVSHLVNCLHQMIFSLVSVINAVRSKSSGVITAPSVRTSNGVNSIKNSSDERRSVQDGGNKDV